MKLRSTSSGSSRMLSPNQVGAPLGTAANRLHFPNLLKRCFTSSALSTIVAAGGCIATFALASLFVYQRKLIWIGQRSNGEMFSAADPRNVPGRHEIITLAPNKVGCYFPPLMSTEDHIFNNYEKNPKTIIFFHGNGDQVGWGGMFLGEHLSSKGFGFFAIEYPGYGIAQGEPTEKEIFTTSESLLEYIELKYDIKRQDMVLIGQSIGSVTALEMARRGYGSKLVLISPFLNLNLMATSSFPFLKPILSLFPFFLKDKLDNSKIASSVNVSTLILHGTRDDIVPFEHGEKLSTLFPSMKNNGNKCKFVPIEGAAHNNMFVGRYLKKSMDIIENFAIEK